MDEFAALLELMQEDPDLAEALLSVNGQRAKEADLANFTGLADTLAQGISSPEKAGPLAQGLNFGTRAIGTMLGPLLQKEQGAQAKKQDDMLRRFLQAMARQPKAPALAAPPLVQAGAQELEAPPPMPPMAEPPPQLGWEPYPGDEPPWLDRMSPSFLDSLQWPMASTIAGGGRRKRRGP